MFARKSLSFGVGGLGMKPQQHHYTVDMPRGAVTIMEGFAANQINHGVKPVSHKVASLLLRRMHPSLLGEEWCAQNTVLVNQKIKRFQASDDGDVSPGAASSGCSLRSSTEGRAPLDLGNGTVVVNGVAERPRPRRYASKPEARANVDPFRGVRLKML